MDNGNLKTGNGFGDEKTNAKQPTEQSSLHEEIERNWFYLVPTKRKHEVPVLYHEPYVETGFRQLHEPWRYYMFSLFQLHNELLNVWTHLIAWVLTVYQIVRIFATEDITDPWTWPLLAGALVGLLLYVCSAGAHCFHSRSEFWHYTCFTIDYAGIGLYGMGAACVHFAYCTEDSIYPALVAVRYCDVAVFLGWLVCVCCCYSKVFYRRPYPFARRLWQIIPVFMVYAWLMIPLLHRFYSCARYDLHCDSSLPWHIAQTLSFLLCGVFFASDVPQRLLEPGACDVFGHSHQLFHSFVMLTIYCQLEAVRIDLRLERPMLEARPSPTLWSAFGPLITLCIAQALTIATYSVIIRRRLKRKST